MSIKDHINSDLKKALLSNDKQTAMILRGLKSVILDVEIAKNQRENGLLDSEIIQILAKEEKKRRESIAMYAKAGETERADREQQEIDCIKQYLPEPISEDKLRKIVVDTVEAMHDANIQVMGQIIGMVKKQAGPTADGALIAKFVKESLSL